MMMIVECRVCGDVRWRLVESWYVVRGEYSAASMWLHVHRRWSLSLCVWSWTSARARRGAGSINFALRDLCAFVVCVWGFGKLLTQTGLNSIGIRIVCRYAYGSTRLYRAGAVTSNY